jgi:hypothetical protein
MPVRVKKMRKNKRREHFHVSMKRENALGYEEAAMRVSGLLGLVMAAAAVAAPIQAAPVALRVVSAQSPILEIFGGCGPYGHRGPYGHCRAGGQWGGYNRFSCPRGWHIGPYGRHCWPN